jgi:general secretion pathway protein D
MTPPMQPRLASIARRTTAFALTALSINSLGQTPISSQAPATAATAATAPAASTTPAPASAAHKMPSRHQTQAAEDAYLAGARLLDRNDLDGAEAQFEKALQLNPTKSEYVQALALVRAHRITALVQQAGKARILGQNARADSLLAQARKLDPQNTIVAQHYDPGPIPVTFSPRYDSDSEISDLGGPVLLAPARTAHSFHLRSDIQDVLRQVTSAYGIRPTFDESVGHKPVRFELDDAQYQQAMPILMDMGQLFAVPLDATSILIAKDTPENRQRFERQIQETLYIPGMTVEQMNEFGNVIRNVFDLKQVTVQNNLGTVVVRAPSSAITPINLTIEDLIEGGNQVVFDLKLYAIDKTRTRNIGTMLPQQIGIYNVEGAASSLVNANQTLVNQAVAQGLIPAGSSNITIALALIASGLVQSTLLSNTIGFFGGGITTTGVTTPSSIGFNLALNSSDTRAIDDIKMRVGDRQPAIFRVGTRYPITTSTYVVPTAGPAAALSSININGTSANSLLNTLTSSTIPQIQFEDLGITLKTTPTVQKSGYITLHIDLKIEALAGGSIDNIPILSNRQFVSDITVTDGETALLASSLSKTESAALSGLPGLGELPGFQSVTANTTKEFDTSEMVLLITPHLVHHRSNMIAGPMITVDLPREPD